MPVALSSSEPAALINVASPASRAYAHQAAAGNQYHRRYLLLPPVSLAIIQKVAFTATDATPETNPKSGDIHLAIFSPLLKDLVRNTASHQENPTLLTRDNAEIKLSVLR